jgi:DNA-binding response OmpR family regulator
MVQASGCGGKPSLRGCRVLIVEDEYLLASELEEVLKASRAEVVGPIHDLDTALDQVAGGGFDVAVIDINLHGQQAYQVAEELQGVGVPFLFATGYGEDVIPARFRDVVRFEKPYNMNKLLKHVGKLCRERQLS